MPDLPSVTNLINAPLSQLVASAALAGIVWKFFDKVEGVLAISVKERSATAISSTVSTAIGRRRQLFSPSPNRNGPRRSSSAARQIPNTESSGQYLHGCKIVGVRQHPVIAEPQPSV
jgi:hypothetical protein